MRVLAVAERAPAAFRGVVGALPQRVMEKRAQSGEMVVSQLTRPWSTSLVFGSKV